jgi:hypothetical protein
MSKLSEQFDVLSNTLRLLPEELLRLKYFVQEINEPEEGISNVEVACVNVFNNVYGIMCSIKGSGAISSIYGHDAISTILCIRHILQHQSGRLKNNLRDAWSRSIDGTSALIKYSVSDPDMPDPPFYINVAWFQEGIGKSNNSQRLPRINAFWRFDAIKQQVEASPHANWAATYVCAMTLITEAVRTIVAEYGHLLTAAGYDSNVYLEHFKTIKPIDTDDYGIIT